MGKNWNKRRKRLFEIIEVGNDLDPISRGYDFINVLSIVLNVVVSVLSTYSAIQARWSKALVIIEGVTVVFFALDYVFRIITARFLYPQKKESKAIIKYMTSFNGLVDLLSFVPYFLPFFFPTGSTVFRMIRIVRIFRLFKINAYYDSLSVIKDVLNAKKQQLISSVFIILVLMLASSLCMYSLEHEAQPEVFKNAFSGIWWSASTLLTVGYGDIYPVTFLGKLFGIIISFLGVGMVAIPTGIISAGFVDQYSSIKKKMEYGYEMDVHFIKVHLTEGDKWIGHSIASLKFPKGIMVAMVKRREELIIPRGDVVFQEDDLIVLGAEPYGEVEKINLKEVVLQKEHKWTGQSIKDLDISRHSVIVLVKRKNKTLIPNGNMKLASGDRVVMYTNMHLGDVGNVDI